MGEWSIDVDESANRLYMELSGHFDAEAAAEATDEVVDAAGFLAEGFEMISDLQELQIGDPGAAEELERGKADLADRGLAAAVRVPPTAVSSQDQFEEVGAAAESYWLGTAESVAAAERLLDER
jgi:hypothetical protein